MRASFLFFPKPKSPRPGTITTEGFESRSFGESVEAFGLIVLRIFSTIGGRFVLHLLLQNFNAFLARLPVHEHGANACTQEMIRAACAQDA